MNMAVPAAEQGNSGDGDVAIRFEGVRKSYDGSTYVVDDLNLTVHRGEFLTMLGPSGSGKTTSLMMLAGFERPTVGQILLDGKPVVRLPPEKRNIGFVFQNYALFPHMTVAQNVAFPLRYRGISGADADARVSKALDMVRLGDLGARRPAQLSGGQQQRVALARALVFEPSLVLMDEPLGALDKQLRERMQIEIRRLQKNLGITMVYVTHDQSEALTMSDRIAVFHDGRIQQLSDPETLYNKPVNRFVAEFIGENNTVPCKVASHKGRDVEVTVADGTKLMARGNAASTGAAPSLSIRPEQLAVVDKGAKGQNSFRAVVRESSFLGDQLRLTVDALGQGLVARLPARDMRHFGRGEVLTLSCDPHHCRLLES